MEQKIKCYDVDPNSMYQQDTMNYDIAQMIEQGWVVSTISSAGWGYNGGRHTVSVLYIKQKDLV